MTDAPTFLRMLIESVRLLAADHETQIKQLPDFVHVPDEIALTYHDCFLLAPQIKEAGLITAEQFAKLAKLDKMLEDMSEDKRLWTLDALSAEEQWQQIRIVARDVLESFDATMQPPNLFWINYIR
jgi:hypothetical protein